MGSTIWLRSLGGLSVAALLFIFSAIGGESFRSSLLGINVFVWLIGAGVFSIAWTAYPMWRDKRSQPDPEPIIPKEELLRRLEEAFEPPKPAPSAAASDGSASEAEAA